MSGARAAIVAGTVALCAAVPAVGQEPVVEPDPVLTPAAPQIVAAPPARTTDRTPLYRWTGAGPAFDWSVRRADAALPLHTGTVEAPGGGEATLPELPDGDYVFRIAQAAGSAPDPSAPAAEHSFSLDATPPPAVRVVERPPFPTTVAAVTFGIADLEAGAAVTWRVIGAGGAPVLGPAPATSTSIGLTPLGPGSYLFEVQQTDGHGNAGPRTSVPFAVIAAPAPTTTAKPRPKIVLPKLRAARLRPRVGTTVHTVRPVLRWARGPRGTTFYNVQVFRAGAAAAEDATTIRLTKLRSAFPRGRQLRISGLKPGRCYVWRVWPYIGRTFTRSPLGVSHFCVATRVAGPRRSAK